METIASYCYKTEDVLYTVMRRVQKKWGHNFACEIVGLDDLDGTILRDE